MDDNYNKEIISEEIISNIKDSPVRSILKAISWRVIASITTFIITYIIFNNFTKSDTGEIIKGATIVTVVDVIAKLIFYYFHERLWTNIKWGKYWNKKYLLRKYWHERFKRNFNRK